jgi:hypothetical protein
MQNYDIVRWSYYILQSGGTYKQQSQSIFNNVVSGGAPPPYFPRRIASKLKDWEGRDVALPVSLDPLAPAYYAPN